MVKQRRIAPDGLRWATGGGSPVGDCNGYHLAGAKAGTLCGRYGPHTPLGPRPHESICGTCARIARVPRRIEPPAPLNQQGQGA